ncbi:MAG TPA: UDP-glucose 4-epimerase GalE [Treponema sp.]|jgi:UDP-glucose 4-epimerase|nr:UDP-glucose 4-epimerase GalE [Treponema sp.]
MKVLVIGGAGYIGSHVVKALMKEKHEVVVFDNLSSGMRENLFTQNAFIHGDILIQADLDAAFSQGFDAFIHLAAFKAAGESMLMPEKYSINNITGTLNILHAALAHNCKRMVFSSSAAIFGEPEYLPIDENHPKNPENYYGFTKLEIERIMEWYDRLKGLRYASLRYFNAAGYDIEGEITAKEQNPANLLPVIMEVASGMREKLQVFGTDYETRDGTCIRDYVHVWDLAIAHVKALDYITKEDKSLFVNLGSEVGLSVLEILDAAKKATAKEIPTDFVARRAGDPECLYAVSKKAKDLLGWKAQYSDAKTLVETTWKVYKK